MDSGKTEGQAIVREERLMRELQRDGMASTLQNRSVSLDALPTITTEEPSPRAIVPRTTERKCFLCSVTPASCQCNECTNVHFCEECYKLYHTHPRRRGHSKRDLEGEPDSCDTMQRTTAREQMRDQREEKVQPRPSETWSCESCTYKNPSENIFCVLCNRSPREKEKVNGDGSLTYSNCSSMRSSLTSLASTAILEDEILSNSTDSSSWHCRQCTFINSTDVRFCQMCATEMPIDVQRSTSSTPTKRMPMGWGTNRKTKRSRMANAETRISHSAEATLPRKQAASRLLVFDKKGEGQWKCDGCNYYNSAKARQCNHCHKSSNKHSSLPANLHSITGRIPLEDDGVDEKKIRMIQGEYDIATRQEAIRVLRKIERGFSPVEAIKAAETSDAEEVRRSEDRNAGVKINVGEIRGDHCGYDLREGNSLGNSRRHSGTSSAGKSSSNEPNFRIKEKEEKDRVQATLERGTEAPQHRLNVEEIVQSTRLNENGHSKNEENSQAEKQSDLEEGGVTNVVKAIVEFHRNQEVGMQEEESPRPDDTLKNDDDEELKKSTESRQRKNTCGNSSENGYEIENGGSGRTTEESTGRLSPEPTTSAARLRPDETGSPRNGSPKVAVKAISKLANGSTTEQPDPPIDARVTLRNKSGSTETKLWTCKNCDTENADAIPLCKICTTNDISSRKESQIKKKEEKSEELSPRVKTDDGNKEKDLKEQRRSRADKVVDNGPTQNQRKSSSRTRNSRQWRNSKRQSANRSRGINDSESTPPHQSKHLSQRVSNSRHKSNSTFKNCIIL